MFPVVPVQLYLCTCSALSYPGYACLSIIIGIYAIPTLFGPIGLFVRALVMVLSLLSPSSFCDLLTSYLLRAHLLQVHLPACFLQYMWAPIKAWCYAFSPCCPRLYCSLSFVDVLGAFYSTMLLPMCLSFEFAWSVGLPRVSSNFVTLRLLKGELYAPQSNTPRFSFLTTFKTRLCWIIMSRWDWD